MKPKILIFVFLAALVFAVNANCVPGQYISTATGNIQCQPCPVGTYSEEPRFNECTKCPAGTFTLQPGANNRTLCLSCGPGNYTRGGGSCEECGPGTYSIGTGVCLGCPAGTYSTIYGATNNVTDCKPCSAGYFSKEGSSACKPCEPGTYNPKEKQGVCLTCQPGYSSNVYNATTDEWCTKCPAGTSRCQECPKGTYQPQEGMATPCLKCPNNTYNDQTGRTSIESCVTCVDGSTSLEGSAFCYNCTAGYFRPHNSPGGCEPCPEGTSQNLAMQTKCNPCSFTTVSPMKGSTACKGCGVGRYKVNATVCAICPEYTYSDASEAVGIESCKPCNATYYSPAGSSSCVPCTYPRYVDSSNNMCKKCPPGTYTAKSYGTQEESCLACPRGTYYSTTTETCLNCTAGQYSKEPGSYSCKTCEAGFYSDVRSSQCTPCPPSTYSSMSASARCQLCAMHFIVNNNSTGCTRCPIGHITVGYDRTECVPDTSYKCKYDSPITVSPSWSLGYSGGITIDNDKLIFSPIANGSLYYAINQFYIPIYAGGMTFEPNTTYDQYIGALITKIDAMNGSIVTGVSYGDLARVNALAADRAGNVRAYGPFYRDLKLGYETLLVGCCGGNYEAIFNSDLVAQKLRGSSSISDAAVDNAGNVYTQAGKLDADGRMVWNTGPLSANSVAVGKTTGNSYRCGKQSWDKVQKTDPNGKTIWATDFGAAFGSLCNGIAVSPDEELVYIVGETTKIQIGSLSYSNGYTFAFVLALSGATGELVWYETFTMTSYYIYERNFEIPGNRIAVDSTGNVYIYGNANKPVHFDNQDITIDPKGTYRVYLARFSKYGQIQYATLLPTQQQLYVSNLVLGSGYNPDIYISQRNKDTRIANISKYTQSCQLRNETGVTPTPSGAGETVVRSDASASVYLTIFNLAIVCLMMATCFV